MKPGCATPAPPLSRGRRLLRSIGSLILSAAIAVALAAAVAPHAGAQRRPVSFIRDAEVEATIRAFAAPLFAAASLDPAAISVHLVNDRSLNAFVANGLHMYINTGLLMRSDNAGQVIGVIAHETGHIQGGHLVQMREQISQSMVPYLLEILATIGGAAAGWAAAARASPSASCCATPAAWRTRPTRPGCSCSSAPASRRAA